MPDVVLHSYFRSSSAYRVRIVLEIKAVPYDYIAVHLINNGGEQLKEDYLEQNPMQQVPTLTHNGFRLTQSMAIIEYLDLAFPEPQLLPSETRSRCQIIKLCEIINSGIQPLQNLSVLKEIEKFGGDKVSWSRHWIEKGFIALEKELTETSKGYSFGDNLTAADAFLIPQVYNANRFNVDMTPFPTIASIHAKCSDLEAFQKAHPANQPDTPADQVAST